MDDIRKIVSPDELLIVCTSSENYLSFDKIVDMADDRGVFDYYKSCLNSKLEFKVDEREVLGSLCDIGVMSRLGCMSWIYGKDLYKINNDAVIVTLNMLRDHIDECAILETLSYFDDYFKDKNGNSVNESIDWFYSEVSKTLIPKEFVYILKAGGRFKIGYTSNYESRMKSYYTECPFDIEELAKIPGSMEDEKALHYILRKYRKKGEWFELPRSIIKKILDNKENKYGITGIINELYRLKQLT